jgi:DNA invertase Pin-like site-specific DNA recombinase
LLTEAIDTSTNGGRLVFHIFAAMAEFERGLIRERVEAGLAAARARQHFGGRRPALTAEQAREARRMLGDGTEVATVARVLGVSRPTIYRVAAGSNGYSSAGQP